MSDWTRGDDPVYDGYRESWKEQAEAEYEADRAEEEERHDIIVGITTARLRELAEAERDGRVVVLPVAVDEIASTPEGNAFVYNWDVTARVQFCTPHRSGTYWNDKYSDFDILDICALSSAGE